MSELNYRQQPQTNFFTIMRVANGWMVQMPKPVQGADDPYAGMVPAMREAMRVANEDPLLSDLVGEEDEPEVQKRFPIIGRDETVHVCKSFQEVLELLLLKFGNLKG